MILSEANGFLNICITIDVNVYCSTRDNYLNQRVKPIRSVRDDGDGKDLFYKFSQEKTLWHDFRFKNGNESKYGCPYVPRTWKPQE
jgi:hypothetical protein